MRANAPLVLAVMLLAPATGRAGEDELFQAPIDVRVPHLATDKSVRYDYDIVYVRARRAGDQVHKRYYTDFRSQ